MTPDVKRVLLAIARACADAEDPSVILDVAKMANDALGSDAVGCFCRRKPQSADRCPTCGGVAR